jgi:hypothetical protein
MESEQLEVGKIYQYQGQDFRHTQVRYEGTREGYWGEQYVFEVLPEGWTVGGGYVLSAKALKDITPA